MCLGAVGNLFFIAPNGLQLNEVADYTSNLIKITKL
jgi:hypothetical protein